MVVPIYMRVTDSTGHDGVVAVEDIEKIVRERDKAVLYFHDGTALPVRVEDTDRLLKCLPELESKRLVRTRISGLEGVQPRG